jgi:hypothetical protein
MPINGTACSAAAGEMIASYPSAPFSIREMHLAMLFLSPSLAMCMIALSIVQSVKLSHYGDK